MANTAKVLTVDPQLEAISQISAKAVLMAQDILALPYHLNSLSPHPVSEVSAAEGARKRRAAIRVIMRRGNCTRYIANRTYDGLRTAGCL
jgi:hypothetical protein